MGLCEFGRVWSSLIGERKQRLFSRLLLYIGFLSTCLLSDTPFLWPRESGSICPFGIFPCFNVTLAQLEANSCPVMWPSLLLLRFCCLSFPRALSSGFGQHGRVFSMTPRGQPHCLEAAIQEQTHPNLYPFAGDDRPFDLLNRGCVNLGELRARCSKNKCESPKVELSAFCNGAGPI